MFVRACAPGNLIAIPNANPGPRRRREAHLVHGRSPRPPIDMQPKNIECLGAVADTTPGSGRPVTRGASEACWPNAGSGRGSGGVHPDQRPGCRRRYVDCLECNGHVWPGATECVLGGQPWSSVLPASRSPQALNALASLAHEWASWLRHGGHLNWAGPPSRACSWALCEYGTSSSPRRVASKSGGLRHGGCLSGVISCVPAVDTPASSCLCRRFAVFCDQLGDYLEGILQVVLDYMEKAFQPAPGALILAAIEAGF